MFKRYWLSTTYGRNYSKVLSEIQNINNVRYLKRIARKAIRYEFRAEAVRKIDDQSFLYKVARKDPSFDVRWIAITHLKSSAITQSLISDELSGKNNLHDSFNVAVCFSSALASQTIFKEILESVSRGNTEYVKEAVSSVNYYQDKELIERAMTVLASNDKNDSALRLLAVKAVKEDKNLLDISQKSSGEPSFEAITGIKDEKIRQDAYFLFASEYKNKGNQEYRLKSAELIKDPVKKRQAILKIADDIKGQIINVSGNYSSTDKTLAGIYDSCNRYIEKEPSDLVQ